MGRVRCHTPVDPRRRCPDQHRRNPHAGADCPSGRPRGGSEYLTKREVTTMSFLTAAWEQVYGLLVEDGQIAVGTLAAFVACGAISALAGNLGSDSLRNSVGPLLFVLLMSLLLVNLYTTGRKAYARRAGH